VNEREPDLALKTGLTTVFCCCVNVDYTSVALCHFIKDKKLLYCLHAYLYTHIKMFKALTRQTI